MIADEIISVANIIIQNFNSENAGNYGALLVLELGGKPFIILSSGETS